MMESHFHLAKCREGELSHVTKCDLGLHKSDVYPNFIEFFVRCFVKKNDLSWKMYYENFATNIIATWHVA